jgi:general secretion pathway protein A
VEHLREFGLGRDPFANDLAHGFYYESPAHRGAERRLRRAVSQHKGLTLFVGEPGTGKSLVARRLFESLEEEAYEAALLVMLRSEADASWLLGRIGRQLGIEEPAEEPLEILAQIYERLSVFSEEGRRPVVIIDDAHLLASRDAMEALRALVDLEYEEKQLLTLVLVGDAELDTVIRLDPRLPHRLDVRVRLERLDLSTSAAYLGHRITAAGGHPSLLEPDAVETIHRFSQGIPRRMNVLADNALFEAHLDARTRVVPDDVALAAHDLGETEELGPLADAVDSPGGPPGGEPIDLTHEMAADQNPIFGEEPAITPQPYSDDEEKDEVHATFFESESPPTVVMGGADSGVDRDVDDLFENLIDD